MSVERRFSASFRQTTDDTPGLAMDDDGTVWVIEPGGSRMKVVTVSEAGSLTALTDVAGTPGPGKSPIGDDLGRAFTLTQTVTQENLDAVLAGVSAVDWHVVGEPGEPPFLNGFGNAPGGWAPCRFRHNLNNTVYVEGVVAAPSELAGEDAPVPIFQLPAEAAPGGDLMFMAPSGPENPSISLVNVLADATVAWGGYVMVGLGDTVVSLCGVAFSVQAATPPSTEPGG